MASPRIEILTVVLCEEVRREITTKDILLGVFPGNIASQQFPARVPLAFWISFKPSGAGTIKFELRLIDQSNKQLLSLETEMEATENTSPAAFFTPQVQMQVGGPSTFRLQIKPEASGWKTIKTFGVEKVDPANPILALMANQGIPTALDKPQ